MSNYDARISNFEKFGNCGNGSVQGVFTRNTRQYSSRMCTARFGDRHYQNGGGRCWGVDLGAGPQVNKFEQVSSSYHQMSAAEDRLTGLMPGEGAEGVPYHVTYPMVHVMYLPPPHVQNE